MDNIPEYAAFTRQEVKADALRPSVDGQTKYRRIPIRRRQMKYEVGRFAEWIRHLRNVDIEEMEKDDTYHPFFAREDVALLILARDRDDIVCAEVGAAHQIEMLRQVAGEMTDDTDYECLDLDLKEIEPNQ